MPRASWLSLLMMVSALQACDDGPIAWQESLALPQESARSSDLVLAGDGRLTARVPATVAGPTFPRQCAPTVRVARDSAGPWYAVWWSLRADSTADVVVSRSDDGKSWEAPTRVDTLDIAAVGCRRVPPSIYVDGENIHVAYAMAAREGPGIFASHSMDRGVTFHTPVPIVYGERAGLTSVAAHGNTVAVAFEDPNSNPRRIGLALSHTLGHLFEYRELVSPPTGSASAPIVAIGDGVLAVTWVPDGDSLPGTRRIVRYGRLR